MNASRADAPAGRVGQDPDHGQADRAGRCACSPARRARSPSDLDMELHGSDGPLDMDLGAAGARRPDMDLTESVRRRSRRRRSGLDFILDEPVRGADGVDGRCRRSRRRGSPLPGDSGRRSDAGSRDRGPRPRRRSTAGRWTSRRRLGRARATMRQRSSVEDTVETRDHRAGRQELLDDDEDERPAQLRPASDAA